MLNALTLIILLGVSMVLGSPPIVRNCGTTISNENIAASETHFRQNKVEFSTEATVEINVHFHIISKESNEWGLGHLKDPQLEAQIAVLNDAFSGSGLTFRHADTTRTVNADWYAGGQGTSAQTDMKNSLQIGGVADLNVYTIGSQNVLGYSTLPFHYSSAPKDDGIVILSTTLPGGSATNFNLGRTLVHETGHWVGLYHTFEGGCEGDGDLVSDTSAEESPAYGCDVGRNTCPGQGVDPIHNYMDYSNDDCMSQFTAGQITRMREQMATYRQVFV